MNSPTIQRMIAIRPMIASTKIMTNVHAATCNKWMTNGSMDEPPEQASFSNRLVADNASLASLPRAPARGRSLRLFRAAASRYNASMESKTLPRQHQDRQPGHQREMRPQPKSQPKLPPEGKKLQDRVAIITGGDSGIGRATAIAFAQEGADVAITYLNERDDARETQRQVEEHERTCLTMSGDIGDENFCRQVVEDVVRHFGRLDVLVNNAGEQHPQDSLTKISAAQLERTFRTNIYGMFFMTKAALEHMREGATIVNTASVTAYRGSPDLLDYSATKGAIVSFTRSLAANLVHKKIRVNAVAPGPIWTPLISASYPPDKVETFGKDTPMERPGQPEEVATCFLFLACDDSSYMTGQVLHPNGGTPVAS